MSEPVKGPKSWAKKLKSQGFVEKAEAGDAQLSPLWDLASLDDTGATLLDAACALNSLPLARELASRGARFGPASGKGDFEPFEWAAALDSAELAIALVEAGRDMEQRLGSADPLTPLLAACQINSQAMALALVERGADIHAAGSQSGLSGLGLAMLEGDEAAVSFCLNHRVYARHELDDGGEGLIHQLTAYHTPKRPERLESCAGALRAFVEARQIGSEIERAADTRRRPGL